MKLSERFVTHLRSFSARVPPSYSFTGWTGRRIDAWMQPAEQTPQEAVTRLLVDWKSGSREALDNLIPLVYNELRRLADNYLRDEHAAATLQPTALVHEAYMRLVAQNLPDWESRSHFFGVAAH